MSAQDRAPRLVLKPGSVAWPFQTTFAQLPRPRFPQAAPHPEFLMLLFDSQVGCCWVPVLSCSPFAQSLESVTEPLLASGRCAGFLMTLPASGLSGWFAVNSDKFMSRVTGGEAVCWVGLVLVRWRMENLR